MRPALRLASDNFGGLGGKSSPFGRPGNGHHRKTTILVIEDDVMVRLSVSEYLRTNGYRVLEASNATEARAIFKAGEPVEVVFSAVDMPGETNGFALSQWIQQEYPDVRVLLTGDRASITKNPGYGQVAGPLLQKPYTFDLLLTYIKRLLR